MGLQSEIDALSRRACVEIPKWVGRIVRVEFAGEQPDGETTIVGGGSCVLIQYGERSLGVTCAHVVDRPGKCYLVLPTLDRPFLPGASPGKREPIVVIAKDAKADLAIFGIAADDLTGGKTVYAFGDSDWATCESFRSAAGAFSFMCGAWGNKTDRIKISDAQYVLSTPLYLACGPIVDATEDAIVSDFSECRIDVLNTKDFPQLADVKVTGGSRDLSGTSGSALWVCQEGKFCLAGTLLRPASGVAGDPKIEFAPVWVLRDWLSQVV